VEVTISILPSPLRSTPSTSDPAPERMSIKCGTNAARACPPAFAAAEVKRRYRKYQCTERTRRGRCPETSDRAPASRNRLFLCQRFHPGPPATRQAPGCAIRQGLSCCRRGQARTAQRCSGLLASTGGPNGHLVGSHYAMAISLDREKFITPAEVQSIGTVDSAGELMRRTSVF
jgi:hypothetical protein